MANSANTSMNSPEDLMKERVKRLWKAVELKEADNLLEYLYFNLAVK